MGSQRAIGLPLLCGVLLLIPFLGGAGAGAPTAVEAEVRGLLAELSAGLNCGGHTCETRFPCLSDAHRVLEGGSGSYGPDHGCLSVVTGCGYHACDGDGEEDLDLLASLLPTLDLRTLEALEFEGLGLRVNTERGAIQLLGCQDRVVMSVPFSDGVRASLVSNGT